MSDYEERRRSEEGSGMEMGRRLLGKQRRRVNRSGRSE